MDTLSTIVVGLFSLIASGALGLLYGRRLGDTQSLKVASLEKEVTLLNVQRAALQEEHRVVSASLQSTSNELAATQEREKNLGVRLAEQENTLREIHSQNRQEFENISSRLLQGATGSLAQASQTQVETILNPLRERLAEFQSRMDAAFRKDADDTISLKAQIEASMSMSKAIGETADSLAKALRGDVRLSGRWGELVLERILELSHLEEGREFVRQGVGENMKNDDGDHLKPDILVRLPGPKCVVIDSKLPLKHYDAFCSASNDSEKSQSQRAFVSAVEGHIRALSGKRYQDNNQFVTHDLVLMFIPIEGALSLALLNDRELIEKAWRQQIVLVGPGTLLMTLKTVASIWAVQKQVKNRDKIVKVGATIYNQVRLLVEAFQEVGDSLEKATESHKKAILRLSDGKQSIVRTAHSLKGMGVKPDRPISEIGSFDGSAEDTDDDDDGDSGDDIPNGDRHGTHLSS